MRTAIVGRLAATCAWVLLAGGASAQVMERYNVPSPGSAWSNQFRNTGSYAGPEEVQSHVGELQWAGQPHIAFHSGPTTLLARPDGAWVAVLGADGKPVTSWDPPTSFEWPLKVGKSWKSSFKAMNHANNSALPVEADYAVEDYEEVTVPAGTFKAYRVRMTTNLGDDNLWWFSPENGLFVKQRLVRSEKSPFGAGVREVELKMFREAP